VSGLSDEYSAKIQQIYDMEQAARSLRGAEKRAADANMAPLKEEAAALEARINELTELSIAEITKATEMMPGNKDPFNILGIIYQNRSAMWFEKRNNTSNYDLADEYDAKAREILKSAMENYEKAVALDPENKDYWRSLFQVYTTLGMNEKAEEAMEKAGM
jgi:tetratricopeptide (TPR) repeat protein